MVLTAHANVLACKSQLVVALVALVYCASSTWSQSLPAWRTGARATFYGTDGWSIHDGSCGYGYIYPDEPLGWNVAAMSDTNPDYTESCGRCIEVACDPTTVHDNYGGTFDRTSACLDSSTSLVIRIVDTCPCTYPPNPYSNKRWCCGDAIHFDMSVWAYERLADKKWGVIGLKYRPVPCDYQPQRLAPPAANPTPGIPPPANATRPVRDWPEYWPAVMNPTMIYQGQFLPSFSSSASYNAVVRPTAGVPALLATGSPLCATVQSKGALSITAPKGMFGGRISLVFWLYMGGEGSNHEERTDFMVMIGNEMGGCEPISIQSIKPTGYKATCTYCTDWYYRYEIFLSAFAGFGPGSVINNPAFFRGCGGMASDQLSTIEFRNYQSQSNDLCLDGIQLD